MARTRGGKRTNACSDELDDQANAGQGMPITTMPKTTMPRTRRTATLRAVENDVHEIVDGIAHESANEAVNMGIDGICQETRGIPRTSIPTRRRTTILRTIENEVHQTVNGIAEESANEVVNMGIDGNGQERADQALPNNGSNASNRKRGPTYMTEVWGRPKNATPIEVNCNKYGQPIGRNRSKLSEYLGTIARNSKFAPIDYRTWHHIPKNMKDEMFNVVKEKFILPPSSKEMVLNSICVKWRGWKSTLKREFYDPEKSIQSQSHCPDERVMQSQWINLITWWHTPEGRAISEKNKVCRTNKKMNHNSGKRPFSQVREEMVKELGHSPTRVEMFKKCYTDSKGNPSSSDVANVMNEMNEISSQLQPNSEDVVEPNDVFSQVLGPEKIGIVRMYGGGVHPSNVCGYVPSRSASRRSLEEKNCALENMQNQLKQQGEEIAELRALLLSNKNIPSPRSSITPSLGSNPSILGVGTRASSGSPLSPIATTNSRMLKIHASVSLLSVFDNSKVVAKGRIQNMNASTIVGGQPLGENWCEIVILVALHNEETLLRPYDLIQTIGDALGVPIT